MDLSTRNSWNKHSKDDKDVTSKFDNLRNFVLFTSEF